MIPIELVIQIQIKSMQYVRSKLWNWIRKQMQSTENYHKIIQYIDDNIMAAALFTTMTKVSRSIKKKDIR